MIYRIKEIEKDGKISDLNESIDKLADFCMKRKYGENYKN
jgi:hypothetical protein